MTSRHTRALSRLLIAIGLTAACALTASAQSLGELAKQEEARRKAVTSPGKTYTTDSLRSAPRQPQPPAGAAATPPATGAPKASTEKPGSAETSKPPVDPKKDEAAWRQRIQSARDALQRAQMFGEALQSQINGLTNDFYARDDPAQRDKIGVDRQRALAELDRVKKEVVDLTKNIDDIRDEARRAGVPPGWLR
jgi:type IV secretory pathway VirB10-like protein